MVVGCPYILIPSRTQLSGPRFLSLTILIFNGLARLLSPTPCQIDRKWDYLSHLRTSVGTACPAWGGGLPCANASAPFAAFPFLHSISRITELSQSTVLYPR